jgi:Ca2+-binding RTX toxin-like protein
MANIKFVKIVTTKFILPDGVNLSYPARLTSLGGGQYLVDYHYSGTESVPGWYGQTLTEEGLKVGNAFLLPGPEDVFRPSIPLVADNGKIFLSWVSFDTASGSSSLMSRTLSAEGAILKTETLSTTTAPGNFVGPYIVELGSDTFAVIRQTEEVLRGGEFTATAFASGFWSPTHGFTAFNIQTKGQPVFSGIPDWKRNPDSEQLVVFASSEANEVGAIKGLVVNTIGSSVLPTFTILPKNESAYITNIRAISLADGGYVVSWHARSFKGPSINTDQFKIFNADGTARTGVINMKGLYTTSEADGLVSLPDGRFIAYIEGYSSNFRIYTADGKSFFYPLDSYNNGGRHTKFSVNDAGDLVILGQGDDYVAMTVVDLGTFNGSKGNDTWIGGNFSDTIMGIMGDDVLSGGGGDDVVEGGDGSDRVNGDSGNDKLNGGSGNDVLQGGLGNDRINGSTGADTASYFNMFAARVALDNSFDIAGSAKGDSFVSIENLSGSNSGGDTLAGNSSGNVLIGNGGNDWLLGRAGNDVLQGGIGRDRLDGSSGTDTASFAESVGVTVSLLRPELNSGEAKGDLLKSIENLRGSLTHSDRLLGDTNANRLEGLGGNDRLVGYSGNDLLFGEAGDDVLIGGNGADQLNGGSGFDVADYSAAGGVALSLAGTIKGSGEAAGDSFISIEGVRGSSKFADTISGGKRDDLLSGSGGNDILQGGGGNDVLNGGSGRDVVKGGAGSDHLKGGNGEDLLSGGNYEGLLRDYFHYGSWSEGGDTIVDFDEDDRIVLSAKNFDGVSGKGLVSGQFIYGTSNVALDANDNFIFRYTDHTLWYDTDGNGRTAAVMIAHLNNAHIMSSFQIEFD